MTIPLKGQEHLGLGCTYEQQSADKDWYNEQGSVHKWHLESLSKFELKHHLSSHSYSWHHHMLGLGIVSMLPYNPHQPTLRTQPFAPYN